MRLEDIEVIGCAILQDRKYQIIPNIQQTYPYCDKYVLINGGDTEGWVDAVKEIDVDNKINIIDYFWRDHFPLSRSQYLINSNRLRDVNKETWVMRFDADEFISIPFLKKMKLFILASINKRCDMIGIRAYDITVDEEGKWVSSSLSRDWYKGLVYKLYPNLLYVPAGHGAPVHEKYNYDNFRKMDVPACDDKYGIEDSYHYKHLKTQKEVFERSARNHYIGGGGKNYGEHNPEWVEFRALLKEIGLTFEVYHDYLNYLRKGNVDKRLKEYFIKYRLVGERNRDFNKYPKLGVEKFFEKEQGTIDFDGASEIRESFRLYFEFYHPDELLELSEDIVLDSPIERKVKEWYLQEKASRQIGVDNV